MNKFVLLLCVGVLLFVIGTTVFFNLGQNKEQIYAGESFTFFFSHEDSFNHYLYAKDFGVANYAPLFPFVAQPFATSPATFFYFVSVIIFLLVPLFLWWLLKTHWVAFFYFVFALPFQVDLYAVYPSFLLGVWLLALFVKQDWRLFVMSIPLSILLHSWGVFLMTLGFVVYLLFSIGYKKCGGLIFACVPLVNNPEATGTGVRVFDFAAPFVKSTITYWGDLFRTFTRNINFVFVFCALKSFVDLRRWDLVVVCVLLFVFGLFTWRFWLFLSLFILIGVTWFFQKLSVRWKMFFVLFSLGFVGLHLVTWFFDKKSLVTGVC